MRCKQCNAEIKINQSYCLKCGASAIRGASVQKEQYQRNSILAVRAVESVFPFPLLENEMILLYYWQGKRLRRIEMMLFSLTLLFPIIYRYPFTARIEENFLYTLIACFGVYLLISVVIRGALRFRARTCIEQPMPLIGIGLEGKIKARGTYILEQAALQRRSTPMEDLNILKLESFSPRFRKDWLICYGGGAVLMAIYYVLMTYLINHGMIF